MKRWILRIALCLMLGAITTVAVAWVLALHYWRTLPTRAWQSQNPEQGDLQIGDNKWNVRRDMFRGIMSANALLLNGDTKDYADVLAALRHPRVNVTKATLTDGSAYDPGMGGWYVVASGWPGFALAVEYERQWGMPSPAWRPRHGLRLPMDAIPWWLGASIPPALPLRAVFPAFLIDTLFYAALWGGGSFGFTSAKRFIRIKRGRCSRCGYDLRGQRAAVRDQTSEISGARPGCPECGWNREAHP